MVCHWIEALRRLFLLDKTEERTRLKVKIAGGININAHCRDFELDR